MNPFFYSDITVYGFHGCKISTKNKILSGTTTFNASTNAYDWLGFGVYFWENDLQRAFDWAAELHGREAAVIGAKINLGNCFDISNSYAKDILRLSFNELLQEWRTMYLPIPTNKTHPRGKGNPEDLILRYLDKIVIENAMELLSKQQPDIIYDSVRAPFQEGFPVYPGSAFREHDHIHLCVRNPDLLTELFDPDF
ncbi:hypothetical protein [Dyadobacter bucti]|uniref:hypothetical protein n=1 Tax=Dyadobacter bucti TaxID=2572203 RepID=UPI003F728FB0